VLSQSLRKISNLPVDLVTAGFNTKQSHFSIVNADDRCVARPHLADSGKRVSGFALQNQYLFQQQGRQVSVCECFKCTLNLIHTLGTDGTPALTGVSHFVQTFAQFIFHFTSEGFSSLGQIQSAKQILCLLHLVCFTRLMSRQRKAPNNRSYRSHRLYPTRPLRRIKADSSTNHYENRRRSDKNYQSRSRLRHPSNYFFHKEIVA